MYHSRFRGNHYEAGYKYGELLYNKGIRLKEHIKLTSEKIKFTKECLKIYLRYFPEVLEEIKGMSAGLRISYLSLASFLFCIYCFDSDNKGTCFAFKNDDNIVLGRNSDSKINTGSIYESTYYNLDNGYSFIGNTTVMVQMEDGINEHGLAVGLTFVYPTIVKPGINSGMLVRYILQKCKTTKEAIECLNIIPIASSQTITLADKKGEIAVVECNCEAVTVVEPTLNEDFVIATNQFMSEIMQKYRYDEADDAFSDERYQAVYNALKNNEEYSIKFAKNILSGKFGFVCQYDKKKGFDTVWSSVYDLKECRVYRAEGNPIRKKYQEDVRLKFSK